MVHKPKHKVHSFKGLVADDGQDEINLERQNVNLAYRIVKFGIISAAPGTDNEEAVVKIYKESQSGSIDGIVNFTDPNLLGVAFSAASNNTYYSYGTPNIIFDNELFSRNIFVTYHAVLGTTDMNYYIEIEEVPVSAAALMQLKLGVARKLNLTESPADA